jgi:O-antigen/teichoic acid export membrane protein
VQKLNPLSLIRQNQFLKNSAIFWSASLGVAFVNYLYYPVLGRVMQPVDYGEVQTIISIFNQISVFFQVLGLIGVGIIIRYPDEEIRTKINNEISRLAIAMSVLLLVAIAVLSPELKNFFHFQSISPFLGLSLSLLISVPLAFSNSYLQGHKRFWTLATSNFLASIGRIIFGVLFILAGFRSLGAVGGILCAQIIALAYSLKKGKGIRHFVANNLHLRKPQFDLVRPELPFIITVFFTSLTTNLLLSLDILFVKHYFSPREAGFYTGISIIANIVYFVTGSLASVLMPSISPLLSNRENFAFLKRSMQLLVLCGGLTTVIFVAVPHLIVTILLGAKFAAYAPYLAGLSIALFALSISNLLIYYHIGLRHYLIGPLVALGLVATVVLLQYRHPTMGSVVGDLEISAFAILAAILGLSLFYRLTGSKEVTVAVS